MAIIGSEVESAIKARDLILDKGGHFMPEAEIDSLISSGKRNYPMGKAHVPPDAPTK